jgi:hypothetical protein
LGDLTPVSEIEAQEMPKANKRNLEDLMAAREAELSGFKQNQQSELFDPRANPDEFNFVFNQYQKLNRGRTDLEEVVPVDGPLAAVDGGDGAGGFADLDAVGSGDAVNVDMVSQLTRTLRDHVIPAMKKDGVVDRDVSAEDREVAKVAESEALATRTFELLERMKREREEMNNAMEECKFEYKLMDEDSSKLYQPAVDGEDVTVKNGSGAMSLSDALAHEGEE